jgi:DNA-binding XRE family transcriptional regulator
MAKPWKSISHKSPPTRVSVVRERAYAAAILLDLGDLRRRRGLTQVQLAKLVGMTQSALSQIEHAKNLEISTLRKIIEQMGGHLRIIAEFPDEIVLLS